jgi:hypothetical protein
LEKINLNKRISDELTEYARKKEIETTNEIKESILWVSMFKSEKVSSLKDMKNYQLTTNDSDKSIPINNERRSIEKEINYLRRKVDRFRAWKGKFTSMKKVIDTLE